MDLIHPNKVKTENLTLKALPEIQNLLLATPFNTLILRTQFRVSQSVYIPSLPLKENQLIFLFCCTESVLMPLGGLLLRDKDTTWLTEEKHFSSHRQVRFWFTADLSFQVMATYVTPQSGGYFSHPHHHFANS